jgi:hypothetical protein
MLPLVFCASCSNQTIEKTDMNLNKITLEDVDQERLNDALTTSVKNQDFRLLITSTRSLNIPGVDPNHYDVMVELCGTKYIPSAGDVIKSENQRMERKKLINYMRQYNEKILILCQDKNSK